MAFKDDWGVEQAEALAALDAELRVVASGKVMCSLAFVATFYVRRIDKPDVRERLVKAFELFRAQIGEKFVWAADPKTNRPKKVAGTALVDVRSWMNKIGPSDDFSFVFHGGQTKDDADPYQAIAFVNPYDPESLSFLTISVPLSWVVERSFAGFAELVKEMTTIIEPTHGYAGWGIVTHVTHAGTVPAMNYVAAFAQRFRGLEVDLPVDHSLNLRKKKAIKGINWLTILGTPWVDQLGGIETLKAKFGEGIGVRSYDQGVIIQAGSRPLLGDVNVGEKMEPYHRVALALKPIRVDSLSAFSLDFYGFGPEQTAKWLARFDTP